VNFSVRQLIVFIALVSLAFSLAARPAWQSLLAILIFAVVPGYFLTSRLNWRLLTWGGMGGVLFGFLLIEACMLIVYQESRHVPINGYDSGFSDAEETARRLIAGLIVPVGFLCGATFCLLRGGEKD